MTKFLLSVHVLAAIVAIGPVTVAASMFPAAVRRAVAESGTDRDVAVLRSLHRICRVYAAVGIVVPVFGLATANSLGVLGDAWLITSIGLTSAAAGVLTLLVLPRQARMLAQVSDRAAGPSPAGPVDGRGPARLAAYTGLFNMLWAVVTVLMIVRPGSTTGV
ncbi:DUF2269 family protein [Plantactinospora sonchi]|uniref:DUF2269 family protein n=1 Tax=Plantactinospora sonchi TaxID=1544735 RepID=A0ABU7RYW5_9ACTN